VSLTLYRKKRDFKKTPEPAGRKQESPSGRVFVVQKHAASRLHYDFRLEMDGVLKSWAVPKGPTLNPADKRLAVHVEDHPLEYGSFEGIIPSGQYGGGTVMLWDAGEWEPLEDPKKGYAKGSLKFRLRGKKLKGIFALVRMGGRAGGDGKNWLLIKDRDSQASTQDVTQKDRSVLTKRTMEAIARAEDKVWESRPVSRVSRRPRSAASRLTRSTRVAHKVKAHPSSKLDPSSLSEARRAPFPKDLRPMLATLVKEAPSGPEWIHETKFDGYRILAFLEKGKVRLLTRNHQDYTRRFLNIAQALKPLAEGSAVLDGEVVVLKADGTTDFQNLQNYLEEGGKADLHYYVFDLPYAEGFDLTRCPLVERKEQLKKLISSLGSKTVRYSDHIQGHGPTVLKEACRIAMEGILSKRAASPYQSRRSRDWLKVKCGHRQEFVIGGYSEPGGARSGFGALFLGVHEDGRLRYAGKVGTGFNEASLKSLHAKLIRLERKDPPFADPPTGTEARGAHWVEPKLVGEVEFSQWTRDGHLRHPSFQGLREDKNPDEVIRETEKPLEAAMNENTRNHPVRSEKRRSSVKGKDETEIAGVRISHPERVLYPEQGLTKRDLALYYEEIAPWILPHIVHRPLSIVRCPQGNRQKCFYQKNVHDLPGAVRGVEVKMKEKEKGLYIVIDDVKGLIALVQAGVLEIHPWGSREESLEFPDRMIFDLDPAPQVEWGRVVEAARLLKERLLKFKLQSFVKTTGGKGLHVVVPLKPDADWDAVKAFSGALALKIARESPKEFIATMTKAKRVGKIFIDYFRNTRGATSIAPYSTRAREGAPVSAPLEWEELSGKLKPDAFNVRTIRKRLSSLKADPWKKISSVSQSIETEMLEDLAGGLHQKKR